VLDERLQRVLKLICSKNLLKQTVSALSRTSIHACFHTLPCRVTHPGSVTTFDLQLFTLLAPHTLATGPVHRCGPISAGQAVQGAGDQRL
jgi:hypothetical protein